MAEERRPPSFERLDREIAEAKARLSGRNGRRARRSPYAEGLQAGIEVIGGLVGGGLLGYGLDRWTGLRPLFLLLFLVLGGAAGLLNAYRHLQRSGLFDGEGPEDADGGGSLRS